MSADEALEKLIHDVNSRCSSLKSAVSLLKGARPEEARELLRLMVEQANTLAAELARHESAGG